MDESEDNISADDTKSKDTSSSVKSKPKKRSLVERELETNLTARITSPVANGGACKISRYGRARRVKTDSDFSDSEKVVPKSLNSPAPEMTPSNAQLPPVYKMYASNSPIKSETAEKTERKSASIETNLDNQIESIYNENIFLSRFSSNEKKKQSPNTKFPKVYVRTDLIQKKEKEETITFIKNMFSPKSGKKSGNSHLNNILERSSEKYNLNASATKTKHQNGLTNMSSVVKTLDFDNNKKKKENHTKMVLSKSEIFDLEAKCEYQVGDLAWARMGTYPFWPCIVTREPITNMFVKKKFFGRVEHHVIHVTFFGDNGRRSWIVDSMLRKFLGQLEFETTREHFGPTARKRDPRLYAAFFVSEKKMSQWSISVEEAETLLREPKRLRIDVFNDMLVKSRNVKLEKQNKSNKVVRTSSNVSLSESLFDTLFSEKERKTEDLDGSGSHTRNSLDVSEVVTACLDNMAAKTGNSKIQRQSHMDRWLQKAKSKTPEKLQVKLQITTKEKEKFISSKKKKWEAPKNVPIKKPYSFRNSLESQTLKSHHNEHDYSSSGTTTDVVDTATENCVMSGGGIGIIAKVESLKVKAEDKKYDILVEITDSVDKDVTCESPTFTQDYNEMYDASVIQDIDMVKLNDSKDSEKPKSNEINRIDLVKQEKVGVDVILNNNQGQVETEFQHLNMLNKVAETSSLFDDKIKKATEKNIEVDFEKTYHKTPKKVCYSDMNGHLEECTKMNTRSGTDISNKKSRTGDIIIEENIDVSISSKHDRYIDINISSDSVTIQDSDTSFNTSSQEDNDRSLSYFTRPRTQNKSTRKRRSLRLKTPKKPHAAKNRDDGFAKYAELRQDALIDDHPELTHTEIMAYLLKTWQYETRDESDADNTSKDIKIVRIEKDKKCENTLNSTMKSDDNKCKDIDIDQDHNQSKDKPTTKSSDDDAKSKDIDISQDHNQSKDKPTTKTSDDDIKSEDINISQDHNQSQDIPSTKSVDDDIKSEDIDISQNYNQSIDKPTTKSYDDDAKSKDIDISKDHNQSKNIPSTKSVDDDIKSEDIDISQNYSQSKDKPTTKSFDDDAKCKDIDISKDHNQSKDKPTTKPSDDDNKSEDIDISQDHNQSPTTKSFDDDAKSKDIDITQGLNQTIDKPIENTLNSTKPSDHDVKSKDIDISQDRNNSKKKVSNVLNKTKRSAIDNIKAQIKNKVCTVNLTDILLDGSMKMTFNNADATFVKAVYDKANKSKKINNKKDNRKNRANSLNLNGVFALKTEGTTSKMNDTVTSCKSMGSDLLNNSCNSVMRNETQNGYKNTNRRRFSVTAIQKNKEKPINKKKTECYTTSMSNMDNNSTNVLSHDKFIEEKDDDQDDTVVGKPENEIPDMESELSLEINNDSLLIKNCSDKKNIQDENLCNECVENKENVNIENSHTEISCAPNSELNIDFTENMYTGSSAIITVNNSNTNVNTGVDNEQEIACILKSIDDIIYDDKLEIEQVNPKLDQNESLEEINQVKKDLNSFNPCDNKEFNQNKEVEIAILTKNDEISKSQVCSKEQPELSISINNEIVNSDKKLLNRNINEADDTVGRNLPELVKINGFHSSDDCSPDFSDGEFNVETSSVNSEDSEPLSKVRHKLRLKNRHKKNIDVNYPEFIKYMELRQDALMGEHPELSQEELVDYMHKTWLYEQNSKSDYMKIDDIERSGLVKGLNDDLRQKSIRNSFRENKKRRNKQKDEDSLSINSDITSKESSPERKLLVKSKDTKSMSCDISDRSLRRKRRIKTLDETLKTQIIPEYVASDMPPVPDNQIISSNANDTENEQEPMKKTQPSSSNDCSTQRYFEIFNHVKGELINKSEIKCEGEVKIKEEFDPDAVSIESDDIEVSLSKRKQRRYEKQVNKDDPEFLKYLELKQDALIDENPQLTQDEIISYLYKTWLYEEGTKSDIKKSVDIEQASLVKGLNPEATQPKKVRRKIKNEKEPIIDDDVVPKDKPKRKTSQPYYIEDELSDTEDIEIFDIFKSKQQLQNNEGLDDVVDTGDEIDEVELYFSELSKQKPNIFKGLVREKVCEICESTSNLVKCKGCSCMFHVDCVKKQLEVKVEVQVPTRGRKKKKKPGRKPKNLDESESQSDEKSQDFSEENNVSIDDLEPEPRTVDAEDFESVLEVKMKELIPIIEIYDSYSSDDGLDWNDSVAGKCEIVDVVLKPKSESVDYSDFKCNNCVKYDLPACFVCKYVISKTGVEYRQRCQTAHCNTYYHMECLDHWPQTQFNAGELSKISNKPDERFEDFMCPRHVCHTCVCDDPRGCKTRFSGDKLARCVRCPATYHSFTKCLPAGSQILTGSHIVCPRHYENRPGKVPCHVNTGWCFICALGGSLICCEYCPTSFHAECLNIKPPEGGYMCEDCETGRLPLYGEMVWVKLGHYRWWPGIVLHPSEIPENILAVKHSPGEFVVRFFGQYDHYWVNRGRVFPFQEGDSGRVSSQKSKIDAAFTTAMEHAQRACEILKSENNEVEDTDIASSLLPPHYVKLKVNKPVGSLCGRRIDIEESSLTQCDCNPDEEDPCGPYSQCLNRMLLTECGPSCRAGDRCNNRSFEKRRYPRVAPYRTPHRGWGLRTLQDIKAGTFVIEYVGELLDEEEFRRRMNRKHEIRDENFYFLTLDKERMIDAGPKGNLARFMNHCCEPNCETQKWTVLGDVRVGLFAIKDIPANTELNFNYNLECTGIEKKRCMCGAKRCSGYIGAKPKQDEPQQKKKPLVAKRPYKKRNKTTEDSPSTNKNKPKRPVGRPAKPKELTEIEKDLLIIKNATNGLSSDSEGSGRLSSLDSDKNIKALKRKRVDFSTDDVILYDTNSPSSKKAKLDDEKTKEVGD